MLKGLCRWHTAAGQDESNVRGGRVFANAVEHGEGLRDLYLVWNPPVDGLAETLDITVINPTEVTEHAPGMANPGGLVAKDPNHESERPQAPLFYQANE